VEPRARVVIVRNSHATELFQARPELVQLMVDRAMTNLTEKATAPAAWASLFSAQDTVGIKVFSAPGSTCGTRPAVVAAVVEGLLSAGVAPPKIVIWDKNLDDLRRAGFLELAQRHGIRAASSAAAGYDAETFYDTPILGNLIWGDLDFGGKSEGQGRKSYVSKLVSREFTKIINVTPLLNHNQAGTCGNLYSLAFGSVDNTMRFEADAERLATAVPEIYALPALSDRVVLNIVDALICQYEGSQRGLLHYSTTLNELRFSRDPVALDVLSLQELGRQHRSAGISPTKAHLDLYHNASLLELGISDLSRIQVETLQ
jgi:uncharacterized protein (DUF362 family)